MMFRIVKIDLESCMQPKKTNGNGKSRSKTKRKLKGKVNQIRSWVEKKDRRNRGT